MILLEISLEIKIAIVMVVIAGVALIISFWSGTLAKKTLTLSKKQYDNKLPDFDLYFIQGFRFLAKDKETLKRLLLFQLTVKNKSEFKNTFSARLELEYLRDDDSSAKILLDHKPAIADLIQEKEFSIFPSDIEIEAKSTTTKWLIFEQPEYISTDHRIERYSMTLIDVSGNHKTSETVLIKDLTE